MIRIVALPFVLFALHPFQSSIRPLPAPVQED